MSVQIYKGWTISPLPNCVSCLQQGDETVEIWLWNLNFTMVGDGLYGYGSPVNLGFWGGKSPMFV